MPGVCVGGEALIDLVPAPATAAGELGALLPLPGGGPYNVAVALGRLGVPVRFLSRLSTDTFGDALLARLEVSGVDTSLVQRGAEPTTLAVAGIGPDGSARFSFHVDGTADRLVADPGELPADMTTLSLGTLSLLLEPGATTYETLLRRHSARGGLTVLDPNVRPGSSPTRPRSARGSPPGCRTSACSSCPLRTLRGSPAATRTWIRSGAGSPRGPRRRSSPTAPAASSR